MARHQGGNGNGGGKSKNVLTSAEQDAKRRAAKARRQRGRRGNGAPAVPLTQEIVQDHLEELFAAASTTLRNFGAELVERRGEQVARWSESTAENATELLKSYIYSDTQEPEFNFIPPVRRKAQEAFAEVVLEMQARGVKPPWLPGRGMPWFPHAAHEVRRRQLTPA